MLFRSKNFNGPNQLGKFNNKKINRRDLLEELKIDNAITEQGVRENLNEGIEYLAFWTIGTGCCVVNYLMADAATCEVSRAQLWVWLKYKAKLNDGRVIDKKLIDDLSKKVINDFISEYEKLSSLSREVLEPIIKSLIDKHKTNFKGVGQPLRIALVGSRFGPGLYDVILSLDKAEVVKRLKQI
mgnify:CR=1 FL=1